MILDGKLLAQEIKNNVKESAKRLKKKPLLACIIIEGNSASEIYVKSKQKACEECGLSSKVVRLPKNTTQKKLEKEIENLNNDKDVTAILLQLPLPSHLNSVSAINKISPEKDVDCLTYKNLGKVFVGEYDIAPCTATGIIRLLEKYNIELEGKRAVVVGRSLLVGRSVATLLEKKNATVTLCHSKTKNLKEITKEAEILVVAIGKKQYIKSDFIKKSAVVVDVGINRENGKIYGDVDFEKASEKCQYISPVPGGVGPLTVACLMENTFKLALKNNKN